MSVKEDLQNINDASKNILQIIDGLLDIEKIEVGNFELTEKEYDVSKMFIDLKNVALENIGEKKIDFTLDINEDIPSKLFGDFSKINRILTNVLDNAVRYTNKGNVGLKATSKISKGDIDLIVEISDTGKGIAKTKLKKILSEKEVKGEKTGLEIGKDLISVLNGSLDITSKTKEGTTVVIEISQKIIDSSPIGDINKYISVKEKVNYFDLSDKRILIVEDNKLNLKVAKKLLAPYKVNVDEVESGIDCLEKIQKGEIYDLILLDQMMPKMTGTEVLHKLKEDDKFELPVIALTADALVGAKEEYIEAGFTDYLSKPINLYELNKILGKYLK